MKTSRRLRSLAAFLALVSVLFAQLAISAYACPGTEAMAVAQMAEEMPGCDMAPAHGAPSALCKAHCLQGDQSRDEPGASLAPMPALCEHPATLVAAPHPAQGHAPPETPPSLLSRRTGPSLAVRHCCFRI